ncbi:OLC1v1038228C1 [Oldenlandia corymbosa var. corymbosa]|uniref:OLC1v1038228C1 n=1 Tax=Oldenlandia corymbosa var. corymbosa TaxID=529605 RepID=A0AAV1D2E4_OLDCO|nr:OLC1v1038228C1 [Oldenlandia corymbosa var. corymbosa]
MEKPPKIPESIQHFSHEHLLERRLLPPNEENCICFGCKLEVYPGKLCYKCKVCPFYLHQVCYNMPQKVQHPVDPNPNHYLTLYALPLSDNEKCIIDCEACQQSISSGFYYNCATCATFYHMLCLATPLSVKLPVHPHKLNLEFSPPYKFKCDLCHEPSHQGWLYRCGLCEVDVHISCAIMDSQNKFQSHLSNNIVKRDGDSRRYELMELLLLGMMDTTQDQQLTPLPDNIATPSIQFSDACFSIEIERSFTGENSEADVHHNKLVQDQSVVNKGAASQQDKKQQANHHYHYTKTPSFSSYVGPKGEELVILPPGIGSEVWKELEQTKNEMNHHPKKASKNQAESSDSGCWCSCL